MAEKTKARKEKIIGIDLGTSNSAAAVLQELQKGYMLNDKVLRHTKVKVSQK